MILYDPYYPRLYPLIEMTHKWIKRKIDESKKK